MGLVGETLISFCTTTSLRGAGRLIRAPTRLVRAIWAAYILLMAAALLTCVSFIAIDYLQYKTIIRTTVRLNDNSPAVPALTICSHSPFSDTAQSLWLTGRMVSPTNFSRRVREAAFELFNASRFVDAEALLAMDSRRSYYQSLDPADAVKVGLTVSELFAFCVAGSGEFVEIKDWQDCSLMLKRVSLLGFFNCYQVQAPRDLDWMTLILRVSTAANSEMGGTQLRDAFAQDIFEQADGIRLQVHENDTYPEPTLKGIHVEPGKLIEISYKTVRWAEVDSPTDRCLSADAARNLRIGDLDRDFTYSYEGCLGRELGRLALDACGCYFANHLRPGRPNSTAPYCGDLLRLGTEGVLRNARCMERLNLNSHRLRLSQTVCLMPCQFHYFDTVTSKTAWRATPWQLHWLMQHSRSFRNLDWASRQLMNSAVSLTDRQQAQKVLLTASKDMMRFFSADNVTGLAEQEMSTEAAAPLQTADSFAYLTLRRQSRNTVEKAETLSLGLSTLMSQIGGLASLFLGLTCAFVVELLEMGLLSWRQSRGKQQQQQQLQQLQQQQPASADAL